MATHSNNYYYATFSTIYAAAGWLVGWLVGCFVGWFVVVEDIRSNNSNIGCGSVVLVIRSIAVRYSLLKRFVFLYHRECFSTNNRQETWQILLGIVNLLEFLVDFITLLATVWCQQMGQGGWF